MMRMGRGIQTLALAGNPFVSPDAVALLSMEGYQCNSSAIYGRQSALAGVLTIRFHVLSSSVVRFAIRIAIRFEKKSEV